MKTSSFSFVMLWGLHAHTKFYTKRLSIYLTILERDKNNSIFSDVRKEQLGGKKGSVNAEYSASRRRSLQSGIQKVIKCVWFRILSFRLAFSRRTPRILSIEVSNNKEDFQNGVGKLEGPLTNTKRNEKVGFS